MDKRINKCYKNLKLKRKQFPIKTSVNDRLGNDVHDDEGNFKIRRFMKDVKRFYQDSSIAESDYKGGSNDFTKYKDSIKEKVDKVKEKGDGLISRLDSFKEKSSKRKDGLFQRGVIIKGFNKGLMPPSLSARLNEDLQKMIELANGKNNKHFRNDKPNKESLPSPKRACIERLINQETCDNINTEIDSPNVNIAETEVQVDSIEESESHRNRNDLYLQFTHFVTRCLFNSGIDKLEIKSYTDTIKESLVETYQNRLKDNNLDEDLRNESPKNLNKNVKFLSQPTPESNYLYSCPSTSKSEEVLQQKNFTNGSFFNDDVVRKPSSTLYTSGLDYLKAVYSESSEVDKINFTQNESDCTFSPVDQTASYDIPFSGNEFHNLTNAYNSNSNTCSSRHEDFAQYVLKNVKSDDKDNCNGVFNINQDPSKVLRYFPGTAKSDEHSFFNNNLCNKNCNLIVSKMETEIGSQLLSNEPPEYISLLPSNRRFYGNLISSLHNNQSVSSNIQSRESESARLIHQSILSLPVHPPARRSPEIHYFPRKMF